MYVKRLQAENFRNLVKINIEPCENINVIYGENAQGKTNIIEGIWLFTGCRSFRGAKERELIKIGEKTASLSLDFFAENREQNMFLSVDEKRSFSKNGIKASAASKIIGDFKSVVFSPSHLSLIKQGPSERRKYLDIAISQLKPYYTSYLSKYNHLIKQRNIILKDSLIHSELDDMLSVFELQAAQNAVEIMKYRLSYIEKLSPETEKIYFGISNGREKMKIKYNISGFDSIPTVGEYSARLFETRKTDRLSGITSIGPHRDDLDIFIDDCSAKKYGSQGQQRSTALALKLGEANMIKNITDEKPVVLLDDVMSELDKSRQDYILNHIDNWQVFITCCDKGTISFLNKGKAFHIENGKITEEY